MNFNKPKKIFNNGYNFIEKFINAIEKRHAVWNLFFTVIALIVAYWLYKETQLQVKVSQDALEMARQSNKTNDSITNVTLTFTRKSLEISERSVAVAEKSLAENKKYNLLSQKNFSVQNKPCIYVGGVYIEIFEYGQPMEFKISLTNTGNMNANNVRICSQTFKVIKPKYLSFKIDTTNYITPFMMPPGSTRIESNNVFETPITEKLLWAIKNNHYTLFIGGKILYNDDFGRSFCTNFCFKYSPNYADLKQADKYNDACK